MRRNTMHEDSTVLSLEGRSIEVSLIPPSDKDLNQCDIAKLMRVGDYAPWNKESSRYWDKGNDVLYQFCEKYPLPKTLDSTDIKREEHIFASKMWLIGRSYAASPERYAYSGDSSKPKEKSGEGYESFFGDIAHILFTGEAVYRSNKNLNNREALCAKKAFNDAIKKIAKVLREHTFYFENGDTSNGKEGLEKYASEIAACVCDVAGAIRLARFARDMVIKDSNGEESEKKAVELEDQYFPLSFSSKFLHFHYPQLVYIFDSIAGDNMSPAKRVNRYLDDNSRFSLYIKPGFDQGIVEQGRRKDNVAKYKIHVIKELAVAKAVYETFVAKDEHLMDALNHGKLEAVRDDPIPCYYNITRMVDALVTNARKSPNQTSSQSTSTT